MLEGSRNLYKDVVDFYESEFKEPLENYNAKQKREDRKIDNYLTTVDSDERKNIASEIIIQIGDKDFWDSYDKSNEEKFKNEMIEMYTEQIEYLKEEVPDFKIINVSLHLDETSPHIHVVGVPVASGYKRGLEKQVAHSRVFNQEFFKNIQDNMRERTSDGNKDVFKEKQAGHTYEDVKAYKRRKIIEEIDEEVEEIKTTWLEENKSKIIKMLEKIYGIERIMQHLDNVLKDIEQQDTKELYEDLYEEIDSSIVEDDQPQKEKTYGGN